MGEAKRKRQTQDTILKADPWCIYCGGPATTIEHMPPRAMFDFRPNQMVFPACQQCNAATRLADLVASFFSTVTPEDEVAPALLERFRKHLRAIRNNVPGLIAEMHPEPENPPQRRGILKVDGPIVSRLMEAFAAKLGFAMHYEKTRRRVGPAGGVAYRWFTNATFDDPVIDFAAEKFWGPETLRQGDQHVGDRFVYRWVSDGHATGTLAVFGRGYGVHALACDDRARLDEISGGFAGVLCEGCFSTA